MRPLKKENPNELTVEFVYEHYRSLVYRFSLRYAVSNQEVAQEVTQDVFLKLWEKQDVLEKDYWIKWIARITKNTAINYQKKYSKEIPDENIVLKQELIGGDLAAEERYFERQGKKKRIEYCSKLLNDIYEKNRNWYEAIVNVYLAERKQADVAKEMGISLASLQNRLYRAKKWVLKKYDLNNITE